MTDQEKIDAIVEHIDNVRDSGNKLGKILIGKGEVELGRRLIAVCHIHDASKFHGIEWDGLFSEDKELLRRAVEHHQQVNPHHPEYWIDIKEMPLVYVAEMACDIKARSSEFGTDVREWVKEKATKKYNFTNKNKVYRELMGFLNLLLEKPFESKI